jgi:glycosyltransferase involved in cell wall biosynthesis
VDTKDSIPLLLIGQTPPPWHGQAVAGKLLFDHDWKGFAVEKLPMAYSESISQVGKIRLAKALHFLRLLIRARRVLSKAPESLVIYPPASANWAPFLRDVFFLALLGGRRSNRTFIFHAAGLPRFTDQTFLRRYLARKTYGGAGMSLEVSEEAAPPHKIFGIKKWRYCPCGVDVPAESWQRTNQDNGVWTILFLGALCEGKGILEIIETVCILRNQGREDFKFRLVGDWVSDELKEQVMKLVEDEGIESLVEFPGRMIDDQKWKEYSKADLFFFPTHYASESSPLVIMEALGSGLPVITTAWSGIPKMLEGCESAVVLPVKSPHEYAGSLIRLKAYGSRKESAIISRRYYESKFTTESYILRVREALRAVWQTEQRH